MLCQRLNSILSRLMHCSTTQRHRCESVIACSFIWINVYGSATLKKVRIQALIQICDNCVFFSLSNSLMRSLRKLRRWQLPLRLKLGASYRPTLQVMRMLCTGEASNSLISGGWTFIAKLHTNFLIFWMQVWTPSACAGTLWPVCLPRLSSTWFILSSCPEG
jgi:hypothetical protein